MKRSQLKNIVYMAVAKNVSMLGTCCRLKVGCVLLREDGSTASTGYNGAPSGMDHCNDDTCNESSRCIHTVHAEENALNFSSGNVYTAYVTHEPCLQCTRRLAMRGCKVVIYEKPYSSISETERNEREAVIKHFNITWKELHND